MTGAPTANTEQAHTNTRHVQLFALTSLLLTSAHLSTELHPLINQTVGDDVLAKSSTPVLKNANVFMQNKLNPSGEGEERARLHFFIKSLAYP